VALLTPASIADVLARHDLRPSRALGQHFLADPNTARRIVRLADVDAGDRVLEIGPGIGSLTLALAEAGARVTALELDRYLVPALEEVVAHDAPAAGVEVVQGDALTVDLAALLAGADAWKLVANLPYNVATPLVARVLEEAPTVQSLLVMVQREVGERLAAPPGNKDYGAISVKVAYFGRARVAGAVPRTVFLPEPNVDSALVRIDRHPVPTVDVPSPDALFALVKAGFAQRRKMLRRALQPALGARATEVLEDAGVDPRARAESLDLDAWAAVARAATATAA
jgi:16S rRNA (adenine1518-N6/adenine1519-N6)-dimethyltransferase